MRKQRLAKNTIASLLHQITALICGFIVPRLILSHYGSEVNGLVNSITQFLAVISFLEMGLIPSALYKPLAEGNDEEISRILRSGEKFFRRIAQILLAYVALLIIFYPRISNHKFDFSYTATLIAAISISSFAQYYFGVVDRLLLNADQHGYIQYNAQTVTLLLNTLACVLLIRVGASIQTVKLTTSLLFLLRPLYLRAYVNRHYAIDRKITYEREPIKQKRNGVAQHIAAVVLDGTDNSVLTVMATLSDVSIYSVYHLVAMGVKTLFLSLTNGIHSLIGELWAKQELDTLHDVFGWTEWVIHTGVTFVFGCTGILIVPFISVYTAGVHDAEYIQPLFAALIVAANAGHCLRLPYNIMILAAGHYKQTQHNYIVAAAMNIILSVATVAIWGLVGVAIGTLAAMLYQTVWMAWYDSKNLIKWPFRNFVKQLLVDALSICFAAQAMRNISLSATSYGMWTMLAVKVSLVVGAVMLTVNFIFYRDRLIQLKNWAARKLRSGLVN